MGHEKHSNDELRSERHEQEEHREELRDEAAEAIGDPTSDVGSQDERRHEGLGPA